MRGYEFTAEAVRKIADGILYLDANRGFFPGQPSPPSNTETGSKIVVTSTTADTDGNYDGRIVIYDNDTSSWRAFDDCKIRDPNGGTLTKDSYYDADFVGYTTANVPLFFTFRSGGTATAPPATLPTVYLQTNYENFPEHSHPSPISAYHELVVDSFMGLTIIDDAHFTGIPNIRAISMLAATDTQPGVVTYLPQTFAGNKTFLGNVTAQNLIASAGVFTPLAVFGPTEIDDDGISTNHIGNSTEICIDVWTTTIWATFFRPIGGAPSITGSRGGNAALASLLTALATLGLIINNTTA